MPRQTGVSIVFVRHGESEANVERRISDNPERVVNLTEKGRIQASLVDPGSIDFAFSSEFHRARQTAGIIFPSGPVFIDGRINERKSGMDGRPVHEFNEMILDDPVYFRPDEWESFFDEMNRIRSFLDEMAIINQGKRILAVSHENPILAALALAGMDPLEAALGSIRNCQKVEISWPIACDRREDRLHA
ncbi:MAG TPA: histidine phosphatase family protein [Burkholderiales bacterium]|nr:histidine phosphatase family protein [Burkholderiales bacterium]